MFARPTRPHTHLLPKTEARDGGHSENPPGKLPTDMFGPGFQERWNDAPLDVRRRIINKFWVITLMPSGQGSRRFDPSLVRFKPHGQD